MGGGMKNERHKAKVEKDKAKKREKDALAAKMKAMQDKELEEAAIKIQTAYRGRQAKNDVWGKIAAKRAEEERQQKLAEDRKKQKADMARKLKEQEEREQNQAATKL